MHLTGQRAAKSSPQLQDQSATSSTDQSAAGPAYFSFESPDGEATSYEERKRKERKLMSQRKKYRIDELIKRYYLEGELTEVDLQVRQRLLWVTRGFLTHGYSMKQLEKVAK